MPRPVWTLGLGLMVFALVACAPVPRPQPATSTGTACCAPAPTSTQPALSTATSLPSTSVGVVTLPPDAALAPTLPAQTAGATALTSVSLAAVGDIMLARTVGDRLLAEGPQTVFAGVQPAFDPDAVLVGNLECTLSAAGSPAPKSYTFAAPATAVEALSMTGFDLVSQANNHAFDYGPEALAETRRLLEAQHIAVVGAGPNETIAHAPVVIEKNGLRLAFLAYVDVPIERIGFDTRLWNAIGDRAGVAWAEPERIRADVAAAKALADVVIVLLHAGWEGQLDLSPTQQAEAHAAIEAGAALVIGAHPHRLQQTEWYRGGFIVYSLGNFVFDGFAASANDTAIFSTTLTRAGLADIRWTPAVIEAGLPRLATPEEAARILPIVTNPAR